MKKLQILFLLGYFGFPLICWCILSKQHRILLEYHTIQTLILDFIFISLTAIVVIGAYYIPVYTVYFGWLYYDRESKPATYLWFIIVVSLVLLDSMYDLIIRAFGNGVKTVPIYVKFICYNNFLIIIEFFRLIISKLTTNEVNRRKYELILNKTVYGSAYLIMLPLQIPIFRFKYKQTIPTIYEITLIIIGNILYIMALVILQKQIEFFRENKQKNYFKTILILSSSYELITLFRKSLVFAFNDVKVGTLNNWYIYLMHTFKKDVSTNVFIIKISLALIILYYPIRYLIIKIKRKDDVILLKT